MGARMEEEEEKKEHGGATNCIGHTRAMVPSSSSPFLAYIGPPRRPPPSALRSPSVRRAPPPLFHSLSLAFAAAVAGPE